MVKLINPYTRKEVDAPKGNVDKLLKAGFKELAPEPRKRTGKSVKK